MLKQPVLNLSVLQIMVFQDRPAGGRKLCSKKVEKSFNKKVEKDLTDLVLVSIKY